MTGASPPSELDRHSLLVAAICSLGMGFSIGPVVFSTFSLLMLPLAREFAWTRSEIALAPTIAAGCAALSDPLIGRLADRVSARIVLLGGLLLFAAANAATALVDHSLPLFYAIYVAVGVGASACGVVPYSKVLISWFDRRRGLMLGLMGLGANLGGAVMARVVHDVTWIWGWRAARLAVAGMILLIPLPLVLAFISEKLRPHPAGTASAAASRGEAWAMVRRDQAFWTLFAMVLIGSAALAGTAVHFVALLIDRGIPSSVAVNVYAGYVIGGLLGRIVFGVMQDRWKSPRISTAVFCFALGGVAMIAANAGFPWIYLAAMLFGVGFGAEVSLVAFWASRYWPLNAYGSVYGMLHSGAGIGAAIGPLLMSAAFDATGSYALALTAFQFALAFCVAAGMTLRPYPALPGKSLQ